MNKKEVAELLGVSERAIERYTKAGKLTVTYEKKVGGGQVAVYDQAQVEKLKSSIENPSRVKRIDQPNHSDRSDAPTTGLQRRGAADLLQLLSLLQSQQPQLATVPITEKPVLTMDEAAAYSGISKGRLADAARHGSLKARKDLGRGYRVKRTDLDQFIKKV